MGCSCGWNRFFIILSGLLVSMMVTGCSVVLTQIGKRQDEKRAKIEQIDPAETPTDLAYGDHVEIVTVAMDTLAGKILKIEDQKFIWVRSLDRDARFDQDLGTYKEVQWNEMVAITRVDRPDINRTFGMITGVGIDVVILIGLIIFLKSALGSLPGA